MRSNKRRHRAYVDIPINCSGCMNTQVARLTWWTRHDKPSETDVMEEARDEEIEMQEIPKEQEEEAEEKDEKAATEDTPAVDTKPHGKPCSQLEDVTR